MAKTLVTGGAGYIGSHTCLDLLEQGHDVVVVDNLANSSEESLNRVQDLSGRKLTFVKADIRDFDAMTAIMTEHECEAVIHFAGLKAVGESNTIPLEYYSANFIGTHVLLRAMAEAGVKKMIFSSSATVYGDPQRLPLTEDHPLSATNPYGRTKLFIEDMLRDLGVADDQFSYGILRYFNPVGAHESGRIGEDPLGPPNNLMPFIAQVAVGRREQLSVFGDDYDTPDGTGVRDYIHVLDLARAHVCALDKLVADHTSFTVNLGTGQGYSVLEMVKAFEAASNKPVPYSIEARRMGDIASCYADPQMALDVLGWKATRNIEDMCRDHWNWQANNPSGFRDTD